MKTMMQLNMNNRALSPFLNERGAVLIISYFVLFALMTLSAAVALLNFNELNYARRYQRSVSAFWLAETGLNIYAQNPSLLEDQKLLEMPYGEGVIMLERDDSDPRQRRIIATGLVKGVDRRLQMTFPPEAPDVFRHTLSVGGNILLTGERVALNVGDRTLLNGTVDDQSKSSSLYFEDKRNNTPAPLVSLTYPDADRNGRSDEFSDFRQFNRALVAGMPGDQVLYIKDSGTFQIAPGSDLKDKKIVFVDGGEGEGNVVIQTNGILEPGQNLTVITTGSVTFNQMGQMPPGSRLNIIAWSDYYETSVLPSNHNGMIFTHGTAHFDQIFDTSVTRGSVVANDGVTFGEVWSTKTFQFADTRVNGAVPPGFAGLIGGGGGAFSDVPDTWREI